MSKPRIRDTRECRFACAGKANVHMGQRVRHQSAGQPRVALEYMCNTAQERHIAHGCRVEEVRR